MPLSGAVHAPLNGIAVQALAWLFALSALLRPVPLAAGFPGVASAYPVGRAASAIAAADLDRDGHRDLLVANSSSNSLSVLFGHGDGTFRKGDDVAMAASPFGLALGDLNEDGAPDAVVTSRPRDAVSVLLGHGDGTFSAPVDLGAGDDPVFVLLDDLSGDGHLDMVVLNDGSNSVTVRLGEGDGTFAPRSDLPAGNSPWSAVARDLDADGHPDLVIASGLEVTVIPGQPGGTLGSPVAYALTGSVNRLVVTDFDEDGALDVAALHQSATAKLFLLFGEEDGTLGSPLVLPAPSNPYALSTADLNGDGHSDLLITDGVSFSVLLGDGAGAFLPPLVFSTGLEPFAMVVEDFNGDGHAEVATADIAFGFPSTVSVHHGNGDGTFGVTHRLGTGLFTPGELAIGDMNGDGKADLVAGTTSRVVMVFPGDNAGGFAPRIDSETTGDASFLRLSDMNGDGRLDVVTGHVGGVSVLPGAGDGTVGGEVPYSIGAAARWVAIGDVNDDGVPDVAATRSNGVAVLLGQGDGTLGTATLHSSGVSVASPSRVEIGDVNGDEAGDLVVSHLDNSETVLLSLTNGAFAPPVSFDAHIDASSFVLGDLDLDGDLDVAASYVGDRTASVILGNGNATFAPPLLYPVGNDPRVDIGFLNGDTIPDLAVTNATSGTVSVLVGRGDGTMEPRLDFVCGASIRSISVGDLDGDGISDVAVGLYPSTISLLLTGPGAASGLLDAFQATAAEAGVEMRWRFNEPERWTGVQVQRAAPGAAGWDDIPVQTHVEGETTVAVDAAVPPGATPWYRLRATDLDGSNLSSGPIRPTTFAPEPITSFALSPPAPNPGVGSVQFALELPAPADVRVSVLDVQGRVVKMLAHGTFGAGRHPMTWDGSAIAGRPGPGIYFLRMQVDDQELTRRAVLLD